MSAATNFTRGKARHKGWVKSSHWIVTGSFLVLLLTGYEILMVHPRLYWGETGNDLTPAFLELPISRNHKHGPAFYSSYKSFQHFSAFTPPHITNYSLKFFFTGLVQAAFMLDAFYTLLNLLYDSSFTIQTGNTQAFGE